MSARVHSATEAEERLMSVARRLDAVIAHAKSQPASEWPTYGNLRDVDEDIAALALGAECLRLRRGHGDMTGLDTAGAILCGKAGLRARPEALTVHVGDELPRRVLTFVLAGFDALSMMVAQRPKGDAS